METVLELEIGPGPDPGTYAVHVLRSVGAGEPVETITLDLEELVDRRGDFEASVLASAVAARRIMTDTEAAIQKVGRTLFESAFVGEVRNAYRTSVAVASDRGKDVQISLRLTAPGLAALPWEALFDPVEGAYLCRKDPLVRHVPSTYSPPALAIEPPLRVLAMVSSPRGLPPLDVERERDLLNDALRSHIDAGRVQIDWLTDVTWAAVHDKLLDHEWHVLHFIGHGNYDTQTDEGVLAFVDDHGRPDYVPASSLADLLDEADPTPRLVLLNSCRSGAGGTEDLFSGTAAALAHSGIHAVAAMQFSISDTAAIQFSRGFYSALARGRGIDEAVRSGRIGILGTGRGTLEWVTPVLYLRGEETRLFEIAPTATTDSVAEPAERPAADRTPDPTATPAPAPAPRPEPVRASMARPSIPVVRIAQPAAPAASYTSPREQQPTTPPVGSPVHPPTFPPTGPPTPPATPRPAATPAPAPKRRRTPAWIPWTVVLLVAAAATGTAAAIVIPQLTGDGETTGVSFPQPFGGGSDDEEESDLPVRAPDRTVPVPADQEWTATELDCVGGDTFEFAAEGEIRPSGAGSTAVGPDGIAGEQGPRAGIGNAALFAGLRFEADQRHPVGSHSTYPCPNAGTLWLGINDANVGDNEGGFTVRIWKHPAGSGPEGG